MQKLMAWAVLFSGISTSALAQPVSIQDQQQWLLEQVRIGEALYRDDLVRDSLARLWLIAPNNPQALAASVRQALLDKNPDLAKQRLAHLQQLAPDRKSVV